MNVNEVRIGGRIGKLDLSYSKNGNAIIAISVATNESYKEGNDWKEKTIWHNLKAFGKTAETINKHCSKGSQIYLDAKLSYGDYVQGIHQLSPEELVDLLECISATLKQRMGQKLAKHSIMELEGLGAEIWEGIDAQEYVRQERASWD